MCGVFAQPRRGAGAISLTSQSDQWAARANWVQPYRTRLRLLRDASRLRRSGLFNVAWYLERYPDVRAGRIDPVLHYLRHGVVERRDPGPQFSTRAYLEAYPDVERAGLNPLLHYIGHGRAEQRQAFPVSLTPEPAVGGLARPRANKAWRRIRRTLLRPRHAFRQPADGDTTDQLILHSKLAMAPTGWAVVHVPPVAPDTRLTLRITATTGVREIPLPPASVHRHASLVRLPDAVSEIVLRRHVVTPPGTAGAASAEIALREVVLHEISHVEAMLRAVAGGGLGHSLPSLRQIAGVVRRQGLRASLRRALTGLAARHMPVSVTSYQDWIDLYDRPTSDQLAGLRARGAALPMQPTFSVLVPVYNTPAHWLTEMIESVRSQTYQNWELCIADDCSPAIHVRPLLERAAAADSRIKLCMRPVNGQISAATNSALELATGSHVALLDHDDLLAPHALLMMAEAINAHPDADLLYSDEDKLDARGQRYDPYFKPDFNPELLQAQNFINHLAVCRTQMLRELGGFRGAFDGSQDYDVMLRLTAATRHPVVHVPHVLYHWRLYPGGETFSATQIERATTAAREAIRLQAASLGENVTVVAGLGHYHRVLYPPPARWPSVTAIVPTRDHLDVLRVCIDGLLKGTDYPALDVMIVDNDSCAPDTLAYLEEVQQRGVTVLHCPGPFNYSEINNTAASIARGEILLLINSDISMIDQDWLREMVTLMLRPQVGAVGAKLLYPDGTVQHAGVVLGTGGVAGHIHLGAGTDEGGYFARLRMVQEVSCCTAACLTVWADAFAEIGGLDANNLKVAFNDVDLCIRLRASGRRILWTPYATLTHWESKSRGSDQVPGRVERFNAEVDYMKSRWGRTLTSDPFFNPNLSLDHMFPTPSFPPRTPRPWDQAG